MTLTVPELRGQAVLVTGASNGIGRGLALGFARQGARVAVGGRNAERVLAAVEAIRADGGEAVPAIADVRDYAQVEAMMAAVAAAFGRIDILINNAGGNFACPSEELTPNGWLALLNTNLTGPFFCARAAFPYWKAQGGGQIINIGSVGGFGPHPGKAPYGAAKAGLINLTQTLAFEWARYGIRVNCVAPGPIMTAASPWTDPEQRAAMEKSVPLGRIGTVEDVAGACLFLASAAAAYITGETLRVDGGPRRPL